MVEEDKQSNNEDAKEPDKSGIEELDAAGRSLSEALRISFIILKVIMVVLIVAFLASGFRTVGSDEQALVLRFGKIRGVGEERVLGSGLHWIFPYPIDEIVKIPVAKKVNLAIRSFWYYQSQERMLSESSIQKTRILPELDPIKDGYCITRSEEQDETIPGSSGSDYSIVHSKWELTYQIDDPERFFKNVYVEDEGIKPGEYFNAIKRSIRPLLENIIEDAVVTKMVNYRIDEALESEDRIRRDVEELMQEKLDQIESGLKVKPVYLIDITWPRQVDAAFQALVTASQDRQTTISEAQTYAENTIIEASGVAQEKIAEARAYRTKVVASAKADAEYLRELLPEYRKYPKLVIREIYQDAIERIFDNAVEKFVIQPTEGAKETEFRILLNRDPSLKPKTGKEKTTKEK